MGSLQHPLVCVGIFCPWFYLNKSRKDRAGGSTCREGNEVEEEPLQLDRPGCEDELIARLFPGISLKPRKSWRLGSWSGRSERGAEPKAGKSRGTLYPRSWAPSSVLLPSQPGGTDATGNRWQMTVNRRQTVEPQQRQAPPRRQTCQEGAPRSPWGQVLEDGRNPET